ncbi:MAG: transcription termination/antitermination factor NusG [Candidatus Fermentibacteraceae bacterium]|nr:transcription termination/antitermination factor NusG [Candidatus Fermentibacteraceae bacterium]
MTEEETNGQETPELAEDQVDENSKTNLNWYVVHSFSGYEKRVKRFLDVQLSRKYPDMVGEVLIPTQEVSSSRRGSKTTRQKKLYPGYVFVQLELNPEMIMDIRAMSNVSGFPPMNQGYPKPLSDEEISRLKGQAEGSDRARVIRVPYSVGQTVRVTEGPFNNFTGVVESINPERGRVRVIFTIFGRKAPVEIDFSQVRPV